MTSREREKLDDKTFRNLTLEFFKEEGRRPTEFFEFMEREYPGETTFDERRKMLYACERTKMMVRNGVGAGTHYRTTPLGEEILERSQGGENV